jgi:hypothetical protein
LTWKEAQRRTVKEDLTGFKEECKGSRGEIKKGRGRQTGKWNCIYMGQYNNYFLIFSENLTH